MANGTGAPEPKHGDALSEPLGLVMLWTCAISLALLLAAPFAAKPVPAGKPWFLAPVNWPGLALITMAITSGVLAAPFVRRWLLGIDRSGLWHRANMAFSGGAGDLVYGALFCGYLALLGVAGFAISTLIFSLITVYVSGLRGKTWWLVTLLFVAAVVLILRIGLGLWFPQPWLFDILPKSLGNFASRYL